MLIKNHFWLITDEIDKLFTKHNYKVYGYTDLTKTELLDKIKTCASYPDSGSFICFLSSHGDQTTLACHTRNDSDEKSVSIIDVLESANTEQLKNRPKLFFIDACRKYIHLNVLILFS